jgi:hypothetical protein
MSDLFERERNILDDDSLWCTTLRQFSCMRGYRLGSFRLQDYFINPETALKMKFST